MNTMFLEKSRIIKNLCCALTLGLSLIAGAENANSQSNNQSLKPAPALPPHANAYGKSLTEWMMLHSAWVANGQDPLTGTIGQVQLLPMPQQEPTPLPPTPEVDQFSAGRLDIILKAGSPFAVAAIGLTGESFVDDIVPPDEALPEYKEALLDANISVTLDGKTILQSPDDNLAFFVGPAFFPEPILFNEPLFRYTHPDLGDIYASGIVWFEGIGFVHPPLSVGEHTLHVYAVNRVWRYGFENTWNITVKSKAS